ncbi:MAG: glycosyltransferase family 4 protein [Syntrophobacterales bacterium]|nr:glycosyltransferase family 4 protein [Syntrophobacterales bacterium]
MRILHIADVSIHQVIGGAERVLYEQAVGLRKQGHEVHILTRLLPEHGGETVADIQGIREWRYVVHTDNALFFLLSTRTNGGRLYGELRKTHHFDIINAHQPFSAWAALREGRGGTPFVYTCHSLSFEEYLSRRRAVGASPWTAWPQVMIRKVIERGVLSSADKIVVLSAFTREKLQNTYGLRDDHIVVIPGGVDLERFHPAEPPRRGAIRRRLGIPAEGPVLLTVRNLVPRMGLENLLTAMKEIAAAVPQSTLVIGGAGPLRETLTKRRDDLGLHGCVIFPGFIPEDDLPDYYRAADLFVLPTVELEGFGLVTLEALASGTPVLGTPVGGTREILSALGGDWLFRDTSPAALAELIIPKVRKLTAHPDHGEAIRCRCREFVESNYSWEKNVATLACLFTKLLDTKGRMRNG